MAASLSVVPEEDTAARRQRCDEELARRSGNPGCRQRIGVPLHGTSARVTAIMRPHPLARGERTGRRHEEQHIYARRVRVWMCPGSREGKWVRGSTFNTRHSFMPVVTVHVSDLQLYTAEAQAPHAPLYIVSAHVAWFFVLSWRRPSDPCAPRAVKSVVEGSRARHSISLMSPTPAEKRSAGTYNDEASPTAAQW